MDPTLGLGVAYLVDSVAYMQHLEKYVGVKEAVGGSLCFLVSMC